MNKIAFYNKNIQTTTPTIQNTLLYVKAKQNKIKIIKLLRKIVNFHQNIFAITASSVVYKNFKKKNKQNKDIYL